MTRAVITIKTSTKVIAALSVRAGVLMATTAYVADGPWGMNV